MNRLTPRLIDLAILAGLAFLALFVGIAFMRAGHPFELEWMEGGMLTHAARLLDGQPIYAAPSADFVPFFYTPGYPAALAGLAQVTGGLSFGLARGVSIVATLVAMGVLFRIGQREAGARWGLLAVGIYAALFRVNGAFYDLARPDALFTALLMGGVYATYYWRSARGALFAGIIFALGFFTKQTVSVFVPACGVYLLWRNWRHAVVFGVSCIAVCVAGIAWRNHVTDGWFWTFIFEGHQGHLFYWKNILLEYWRDLLVVAPLLLLLPLLWFSYKVRVPILAIALAAWWTAAWIYRAKGFDYDAPHMYYRDLWFYEAPRWRILVPAALIAIALGAYRWLNRGDRPTRPVPRAHGFWLWMFIAGAGASGLNHSTQWAYSNSLMLISLFASVLIALAVRDLTQAAQDRPRASWLIPTAVLVQMVAWIYSPTDQLPGPADLQAKAELDARLSAIRGKILIPAHPFYAWQRDGRVHVHQMGIQDVAFMGGLKDLPKRLRRGEWAAVVVEEQTRVPGLDAKYYLGERLRYPSKDALRAKTGFTTRPAEIWYRQDPAPRMLAPGISANFEEAGYTGWAQAGGAFGTRPSPGEGRAWQGHLVTSSTNGGPKAKGNLVSRPFEVQGDIDFLLGGSGKRKVAVRLLIDGKPVTTRRGVGVKRGARRVRLATKKWTGQMGRLEIRDDDPKGSITVDDLRMR
ncbi:MAG: hypothetical protein ACI9U2_001144 [Bradymonadia bacterium]